MLEFTAPEEADEDKKMRVDYTEIQPRLLFCLDRWDILMCALLQTGGGIGA